MLLAEARIRALTGELGEWLPDATSDGASPNDYESGYSYAPKGPYVNWAQKTKLDALEEYKKQAGEKANLNGVYFTAERVDYQTS